MLVSDIALMFHPPTAIQPTGIQYHSLSLTSAPPNSDRITVSSYKRSDIKCICMLSSICQDMIIVTVSLPTLVSSSTFMNALLWEHGMLDNQNF
jgi:hypothetical protein